MQVQSSTGGFLRAIASFFRGVPGQPAGPIQPVASSPQVRRDDPRGLQLEFRPPPEGFNPNARRGTYLNIVV